MTRQVFALHGGTTFEDDEEFLVFLQKKLLELKHLKPGRDWKSHLEAGLGEGYDVYLPQMPNKQNAKYREWKVWFERIIPLMEGEPVLIGHSLGGLFLAKYLSEEPFPVTPHTLMLIAAPFDLDRTSSDSLADFVLPASLAPLRGLGSRVHLYHSTDDMVVPYDNALKYQAALPEARLSTFSDRGHFNQEAFPELVDDIHALEEHNPKE